jgi:hypothetical protein
LAPNFSEQRHSASHCIRKPHSLHVTARQPENIFKASCQLSAFSSQLKDQQPGYLTNIKDGANHNASKNRLLHFLWLKADSYFLIF